jgi:hypothetical protein
MFFVLHFLHLFPLHSGSSASHHLLLYFFHLLLSSSFLLILIFLFILSTPRFTSSLTSFPYLPSSSLPASLQSLPVPSLLLAVITASRIVGGKCGKHTNFMANLDCHTTKRGAGLS